MLPAILGVARIGAVALRGVAAGIGATARVAVTGATVGARAIGRGIAAGARGTSKAIGKLFTSNKNNENQRLVDSDATLEPPDNAAISTQPETTDTTKETEATSNINVSILKSVSDQINILRKTVEQYESVLFKREQTSEAADIEKKIESADASKIDKTPKREDKKSQGFIQKLLNALLFTVFAFLPEIMTFFKESKQAISALPQKILDSFKGIIDSISGVIKEYVVDPIVKFFKVDVGAALDTLFLFIGDSLEAIMDVPKRLINATSLFANSLVTDIVQKFVDVINQIVADNPILKRIGVVENIVKSANDKLVNLKEKKNQLEQESGQLEERAVAREKTTISDTFEKQQAQRLEQYQKEHPDAVSAPKIQGMDDVKAMIKLHEGVRDEAYKDSLGKWTIGVGHLIGDGSSPGEYAGRKLSPQEIDDLFEEDFAKHVRIAEKTPGWNLANDAGKAAMIDLAFNMGYWWKKWPNTAKALSEGNFDAAANGLQDSKWYTQVGRRAPTIVSLMRAGKGGGIETTGTAGTAVAEAPAGMGEQIGPKPKPEVSTTSQVAVVVPPASPTGGNAGGKKPVSKPDPNQVQRMYAQGLGMPGTA